MRAWLWPPIGRAFWPKPRFPRRDRDLRPRSPGRRRGADKQSLLCRVPIVSAKADTSERSNHSRQHARLLDPRQHQAPKHTLHCDTPAKCMKDVLEFGDYSSDERLEFVRASNRQRHLLADLGWRTLRFFDEDHDSIKQRNSRPLTLLKTRDRGLPRAELEGEFCLSELSILSRPLQAPWIVALSPTACSHRLMHLICITYHRMRDMSRKAADYSVRSGPVAPLHPEDEVVPGVRFGREDELLTPAYWAMRCATADPADIDFVNRHGTFEEEIGFCLLGGFGVTVEVATAFFERLRTRGAFEEGAVVPEADLFAMLDEPALVCGRPHRYRFPAQRARRLHRAMANLPGMEFDESDPIRFRHQIQSLEGVGPKTASWIARNWLNTDSIAILDIHVLRAGCVVGLFDESCRLPRDYLKLERRFVKFADNLRVRASVLDSVMWLDMRTFGSSLLRKNLAR